LPTDRVQLQRRANLSSH